MTASIPTATTRRRTALLCLLALPVLMACRGKPPQGQALAAGTTVLALGDSLTAGVGAQPGQDWPSLLATMTQWEVINAGISGDTSAQGLARLPDLLAAHTPRLVIIGLGGNDFLRRQPAAATQQNLAQAIRLAQASGAQVVLQAIPQPSLLAAVGSTPSDHPLYATLASEFKIPLLSGLWGDVLVAPEMRSDAVHANAQGYAAFAQAQFQALQQLGFIP